MTRPAVLAFLCSLGFGLGGGAFLYGASLFAGSSSLGYHVGDAMAGDNSGALRFTSLATGENVGATCTKGDLRYDTTGTKEICLCAATDTWTCWSADTAAGPTD